MPALHRPPGTMIAVLVAAVSRVRALRALDTLITGLRTMLSIAGFGLLILLFQFTENVILVRDAVQLRLSRRRSPGRT